MSIQKKIKKKDGKDIVYYYPVISTYQYTKSKTPLWGPGFLKKRDAEIEEAKMKLNIKKLLSPESSVKKILNLQMFVKTGYQPGQPKKSLLMNVIRIIVLYICQRLTTY